MKKIFTLAFSIIICSSMFASAEFFIKINNNGIYTVSINDQVLSSNSNTFRFFDLYAGNQTLTVVQKTRGGNRVVFEQSVFIADGFRTVAELNQNYNLQIVDKLAFVQKSWYIDNVLTNQNPTVYIPNCPVPNTPVCNIPPRSNYNNGYNQGWNNGAGSNNNYPYNNNYPNNYPNNNYPNNGGNYGYNGNFVDDATLASIMQTMKNATFEDKMIAVGKTALNNRVLKTNQVHQLLSLFTFEANKLEFAKYCYDKTLDQNNYYTLYNDFAFNNYSTQLDKYINSK